MSLSHSPHQRLGQWLLPRLSLPPSLSLCEQPSRKRLMVARLNCNGVVAKAKERFPNNAKLKELQALLASAAAKEAELKEAEA